MDSIAGLLDSISASAEEEGRCPSPQGGGGEGGGSCLSPARQDLWRETMEIAGSTVTSSAWLSTLPTERRLHRHPNH